MADLRWIILSWVGQMLATWEIHEVAGLVSGQMKEYLIAGSEESSYHH